MSTLFGVDDLVAEGRRQARRLVAVRARCCASSAGTPARAPRRCAASRASAAWPRGSKREGQAIVETRCERGADVVRQLELPEAARRRRARARRALGRDADSRTASAATRSASSGASAAWPRTPSCSSRPAARRRCARCSASGADAGSSPTLADALLAIDRERPHLARAQQRRGRAEPRRPRTRRTSSSTPTMRASTRSPRRSLRSSTRSRPTPRATRTASPCTRARSARSSGSRAPSCATSAAARCCTTSASSASRTRSSTSRASSTTHEFALIRSHPVFTEQILARVPAFAPLAPPRRHTTSASTAAATPTASRGRRAARRTAACSRSPTCSRRSRPTARIATACRSTRRSTIMRRDAGSHLCSETLDALERGLEVALPLAA